MTASAITATKDLLPELTLVSQGKVRDIYSTSDSNALLFVATDRISAYDVILKNVSTNYVPQDIPYSLLV
jgi:phosphoribosylaminoimidazole-succinocarboxamide synthase